MPRRLSSELYRCRKNASVINIDDEAKEGEGEWGPWIVLDDHTSRPVECGEEFRDGGGVVSRMVEQLDLRSEYQSVIAQLREHNSLRTEAPVVIGIFVSKTMICATNADATGTRSLSGQITDPILTRSRYERQRIELAARKAYLKKLGSTPVRYNVTLEPAAAHGTDLLSNSIAENHYSK